MTEALALFTAHRPLVEREAWRIIRRLPASVERDDMVQVGLLALWLCTKNFTDTGEPDAFQRFATPRVRGAMLDELRSMDHLSRHERAKVKAAGASTDFASLDDAPDDATAPDWVEREVDRGQALARVEALFERMDAREQLILSACADGVGGMTRAARQLGVTPSRVSQIYAGLLARIRRLWLPSARPEPEPEYLHVGPNERWG